MNFKKGFSKLAERLKSFTVMIRKNTKPFILKTGSKIKHAWQEGKIQRSSRITYDVVWNIILFFLIIGFILLFFIGGIGAGYFASLINDEPIRTYADMKQDIYNYEETSKLYFAGDIYIGNIQSDLYREETTLDNVSQDLINAVIATEDEYFTEHKGIVPKAIFRAMIQEFTNSSVQTGGSTLTQQLIKNQILSDEVSFERKAKEMLLALRLERFFEKDEILEAYLNVVPFGRDASGNNIAGIQTAAQGIFGVDADELNLPQAAYLAGLPQSPSAYTPFTNDGKVKDDEGLEPGLNRMKTVLARMYDNGFITKKEYKKALEYDITADFTKAAPSPIETYPYLTFELEKEAKKILAEIIAEEDGYSAEHLTQDPDLREDYEARADRELRVNGYHIHSTIDKDIHEAFQRVVAEYPHYGPDRTVTVTDPETGETIEKPNPVQTGAILIENTTGRIISFVGGREFTQETQLNYATNAPRSVGSVIKPVLDYAPAMEEGYIQPATPIADYPKTFAGYYRPKNYGGANYGIVSARTALVNSYNIPAVETYMEIIDENPVDKYLEKMGITSLTENDHVNPALALGGTEYGITVEEMTNAFATFGNNGEFVDAYMIEKITTNDGEVIYEHKPEAEEVFSPETSYLTIDILRDVLTEGTGRYVLSQLNNKKVDWAGKTGTSNDYKDAWFIGTNPNVTFGLWMGYDQPASLNTGGSLSYSQRVQNLWSRLVNEAEKIKPDLVTPSDSFARPDGIVEQEYCAVSGKLPSDPCEDIGLVKNDIFNKKYVPDEKDDSLIAVGGSAEIKSSSLITAPNTPREYIRGRGIMFNPEFLEQNGYDELDDLSQLYPRTEREKWEKIGLPVRR